MSMICPMRTPLPPIHEVINIIIFSASLATADIRFAFFQFPLTADIQKYFFFGMNIGESRGDYTHDVMRRMPLGRKRAPYIA